MSHSHEPHACEGCDLPARREFVARLATSLASIALFLGARDAEALAPVAASARGGFGEKKSYDVPVADGVQIDKDTEVILVRQGKQVWAFALSCPHQNTALRWNAGDGRFQCPKHKSKYRPDGSFIEGRATRAMDRYALSHEGSTVVVNLEVLHKQDADPAGWAAAQVTLP